MDSVAFFCEDFDEDGGIVVSASRWTANELDPGAGLDSGIDESRFQSKPASFSFQTSVSTASTPGSCDGARLHKDFPSSWHDLTLELDWAGCPSTVPSSGALGFISVDCTSNGTTGGIVKWALHSNGMQLVPPIASDWQQTPPPATDGTFTHLRLDVTLGASGSASLTVGDGGAVSTGSADLSCDGGLAVAIGILDCTADTACRVNVDNVVLDGH